MISSWLKKIVLVGVILSLGITVLFAARVVQADLAFFRAEKFFTMFRAEEDDYRAIYLVSARRAIDQALRIWPDNPQHLSLAAQIHAWEGHLKGLEANSPDIEIQHYRESIALFRQALRLSPAHARTWALLAEYKIRAGERDEEWRQAVEKALELGGSDPAIVKRMFQI
jgi:cytochrome c-type biogenesis protein CcmH/NrfG